MRQPKLFIELSIFLCCGSNPLHHQVEPLCKLADLIPTTDRHSCEQLAASDGLHRREKRSHGAVNPKIQKEVNGQNNDQTFNQNPGQFQTTLRPLEFVKERRREFRISGADEPAVNRNRRRDFHPMGRFPASHIAD